VSLSTNWNNGFLAKLLGLFRSPRDPTLKNIQEAIYVLDKMANFLDTTRRTLEDKYEEHQRRAKLFASEGKRDYERIFVEESRHIANLISIFTKVHFDIMRVRHRLETLTLVEEPLKLLPEIAQELDMIKPEIERIAPELTTLFYEVRRRVNSIMSSSNLETLNTLYSTRGDVREEEKELLPLPPREKPSESMERSVSVKYRRISYKELKKLILEEIRRSGGVFVVSDFARKYGVPREMVRIALRKLEEEGLIKSH
jgi:division protein CdvB (Snf7/Vps24/ESCRT-III family)